MKSTEYNLEGLALYSHIPEDTLYEILAGLNKYPSITIVKKIADIHRQIRPELYKHIIEKIQDAVNS